MKLFKNDGKGKFTDVTAKAGDLANRLGWMPPMRSTAIAELRRGVTGDPASWMAATGIVPKCVDRIRIAGIDIPNTLFDRGRRMEVGSK